MILHGWFLFALTSADRVLEEGLLDLESLESSFLQISIENVTLTHVSEVSPWVSLGTVHMSIYLVAFLLVPICALAFAGPKWLLVAMITCADSTCTELPMAIFPVIAEGPVALGALVATKPYGQLLATPLVLRFTRHREVKAMELGLLLQSAGLLLQGFTPSLGAWFAARAAQGVGSGLVLTANMATGTDAFEEVKDSNYVEPMILVYSMYIGAVCGAPFGGVGFTIQPFLPFLFLGLAELVLLAAVHSKLDAPSIAMPGTQPLLSLLQYPMISRPVALICLLVMYTAALQAMLFRVLEEDLELTVGAASFTWLFQAWPAILGVLCLGPAAQRIGFRLIMLTGILLAGTSALLADESLTVLILELVAVGLALGAENATVPRLLEDVGIRHFEAPVSNNIITLLNLGQQLGYVMGPLTSALLCHVSSFQTMCRFFGVLLLGYALAHTAD